MLRQLRPICWNENMPVHAPPLDCSLTPPQRQLPRIALMPISLLAIFDDSQGMVAVRNKLLCDRHLQGGRSVAFERGAAHVAYLARLPIASDPMHSLAIVPHHKIMLPPNVGVNELSLGRMLDKIAHKGHCFRHRPADDAADVGGPE